MSQRSPVASHILQAAQAIEGAASEFEGGLESLNAKVKTLQDQAGKPTSFPPEDLSAEFATLDNALAHLQKAGSLLRGAASAVDNAGGSSDLSNLGQTGQGTGTGGGAPVVTPPDNPPSGSNETGPSGLSQPATFGGAGSTGNQSVPTEEEQPTDDAAFFDEGGAQESPGVTSDSGGVTPLNPTGGGEDSPSGGSQG